MLRKLKLALQSRVQVGRPPRISWAPEALVRRVAKLERRCHRLEIENQKLMEELWRDCE